MKQFSFLACALALVLGTVGAQAQSLADGHGKAGGCTACHASAKVTAKSVDDDERALSARCQMCHGSYDKLASKSKTLDPHASHLGNINCTACHKGHEKPRLMCNDCHSFAAMKMPFANAPAKADWAAKTDSKAVQKALEGPARERADVVVIGAGSTGYNAALAAKKAGARVVLLEKHSFSGGNSMLAAGGYNAVGTPQQKAKGIEDSVQWYIEDTMKGGRYKNDPKLVEILATQSAGGVAWLESLGADLSEVKRSGGARVDRTHRPSGGRSVGPHIIDVLRAAALKEGIPARLNSRVVKINLDADYRIDSVIVHAKHTGYYKIQTPAVVLATGGYGQNQTMVATYRPTFAGMTSSNNVTSTGDGIAMALSIGASMTDIDWVQAHPTVGKDSRILISETVRGVGAVMVNSKGARFINELTTRDRASDAILHQPGRFAWLVFDQDLYARAKMVRGYDHLSMLKKADTLEQLAEQCRMDVKTLTRTAQDYNRYRAAGKDEAFGRDSMPLGLSKAPYYAVKVAPGIHHTMGGVAIDTQSRVLDIQSRPIPGLFAAGEVTGGVHGFNRLGGNAVADTVIFGRRAGEHAAQYSQKK